MAFARLLRTSSLIVIGMLLSFVLWETALNRQSSPDLQLPQEFSVDLPGCLAIISGDTEGRREELEVLVASGKISILSEDFYLNVTKDCPSYIEKRGFITAPLSEEEDNFTIAYSMVIHEKIVMFERLLRAVYTPQNIYCVHVDQKSSKGFQKAVEAIISCFPNKYLLNTCGTDFPIKSNAEMVQTLKALNGRNSMESEVTGDYKKVRWLDHYNVTVVKTDVKNSPPPIGSPMFKGSAYFVVSRAFVEHWERDTYSPDEHLWATLQRMPSVRGVCVHGAGDLPWLLRQYQLFANKFDPDVDDIAIRCIESVLCLKASGQDRL
uniref:Beta-1,3-galactosyl-O-glycosyl-glycoprotein beta-1,6-N-acetylglucosaminyltransferase 3 n=1 Tax=Gasterosteus aculeatus aculeatus TaxID=481459 RepID=A0AAQ4QVF3_GASAC